jgi:hypothetical protein
VVILTYDPSTRRLRQEDLKFYTSLGHTEKLFFFFFVARFLWLTSVVLTTDHLLWLRRQKSGGSCIEANQGKQFARPYLKKNHHKKKGWWSGSKCRP